MFYILIIFLKDLKRCKYTIFITFDIFFRGIFSCNKRIYNTSVNFYRKIKS